MFLAILTFLSALTISAVAIYYSVAGLAAIFAAAVIPIVIMGVSLEVGKLVTAVWLHRNWNRAVWWLKTYLAVAVVVLMFITSMGIFGYLSKAHIEQTSMSIEQVAQIDSLEEKMIRSTAKVDRWTSEIDRLLKGDNVRVDTLIEKEQDALSKVYARINEEKKLANDQANSDIQLLTNDKESAQTQADREIKLQNDRLDQAKARKEADIAAAQKKFEESFGGAKKLEDAGSCLMVLECIKSDSAKKITNILSIPTIGIGASINCDGQVLVINDLLCTDALLKKPRFIKSYVKLNTIIENAVKKYCEEVINKKFPLKKNSY